MTGMLRLRLTEGNTRGRALVGISPDHMQQLGIEAGDTVAITADRTTHARVVPVVRRADEIAVSSEITDLIKGAWGSEVAVVAADLKVLNTAVVKLLDDAFCSSEELSECLYDLPLTEGDIREIALPLGKCARIEIVALDPAPAGRLTDATALTLQATPDPVNLYQNVGGLTDQIARVHEMVAVPLLRPDLFARLGVAAPRGVLFTGPPGSGKTLLARSIAAQTSAAFFQINGPEIVSKHYGESEAALRKVFQAAEKDAPSIIFIDEIDAIAPRRDALSGEKQVERRVVAQLLTLMDGLAERGRVILMAATNLPDSLDPALRRPGRFDREIAFGPPTAAQRHDILKIHLRDAPVAADVDLHLIAQNAHGYVGADIAALAREASLAALDRAVQQAGGEDRLSVDDLYLTQPDLLHGLSTTSPSTLRDTIVESPAVTFADVGGMDGVKATMEEAVIWPQKHKDQFEALGIAPLAGILLSGPPGSGKTLLARALATESGMNFIPVRPTRIMSQFLGDAERAIAEIFAKARQSAPCLVFFDELDALAPRRSGKDAVLDRIVAQLLSEMDGMARNPGVVVLAATNRAAAIDPALTRPGRFDMVIPVPLPDAAARHAILAVHIAKRPLADDVLLSELVTATDGASGADLASLVRAAARVALRRCLQLNNDVIAICAADFEVALAGVGLSNSARSEDFIAGQGRL